MTEERLAECTRAYGEARMYNVVGWPEFGDLLREVTRLRSAGDEAAINAAVVRFLREYDAASPHGIAFAIDRLRAALSSSGTTETELDVSP